VTFQTIVTLLPLEIAFHTMRNRATIATHDRRRPMPLPRKREIEAAIAAYNKDDRKRLLLLPPEAARLLSVMFPKDTVYRRSVASLVGEGSSRWDVVRLLDGLREAGFLSKKPAKQRGIIPTYRLHLPPRRRQPAELQ
jgi:hypothetical protein